MVIRRSVRAGQVHCPRLDLGVDLEDCARCSLLGGFRFRPGELAVTCRGDAAEPTLSLLRTVEVRLRC